MSPRWVSFFFWGSCCGCVLDLLLMTWASRIPVLASASKIFAVSALAFALAVVANYLLAIKPKEPNRTK